jgi:hypothetical protein
MVASAPYAGKPVMIITIGQRIVKNVHVAEKLPKTSTIGQKIAIIAINAVKQGKDFIPGRKIVKNARNVAKPGLTNIQWKTDYAKYADMEVIRMKQMADYIKS